MHVQANGLAHAIGAAQRTKNAGSDAERPESPETVSSS
jgi:hypothetical protein